LSGGSVGPEGKVLSLVILGVALAVIHLTRNPDEDLGLKR